MDTKEKTIPGLFEMTSWLIFLTTRSACSNKFAKKMINTLISNPQTDWKETMIKIIEGQKNAESIADKIVKDNFEELDKDYNNGKLNVERKLTSTLSKELNDYQPFQEYGVHILIAYGKLI